MTKGNEWHGTHGMANILKSSGQRACYCIGPQNGEPLCPCGMRAKNSEEHKFLARIMEHYTLVPKKRTEDDR